MHYRLRPYSLDLKRFISEDPIGFLGGVNLYAYTGNSPLNYIDPLGLDIVVPILSRNEFVEMLGLGSLPDWVGDLLYSIYTDPSIDAGVGCAYKGTAKGVKALIERHHLLPLQYRKRFAEAGLDIEEFVIYVQRGEHRLKAYNGLHTGTNNWNKQWGMFFKKYKKPKPEMILDQLQKMKSQYGLK
jgi:hypothetical protein